ncbi:MAG: hypothetical protein AAFX39_02480 [Pseudomonadota bacterium]
MSPFTDDRWMVLRRLYEAGAIDVDDIAALSGLKPATIRARIRKQSWLRPVGVNREVLLDRLWRGLAAQVEDLGARGSQDTAPQFEERGARTLSTLIRAFEKLREVEAVERAQPTEEAERDLDAFREALATRLEALATRFEALAVGESDDETKMASGGADRSSAD